MIMNVAFLLFKQSSNEAKFYLKNLELFCLIIISFYGCIFNGLFIYFNFYNAQNYSHLSTRSKIKPGHFTA